MVKSAVPDEHFVRKWSGNMEKKPFHLMVGNHFPHFCREKMLHSCSLFSIQVRNLQNLRWHPRFGWGYIATICIYIYIYSPHLPLISQWTEGYRVHGWYFNFSAYQVCRSHSGVFSSAQGTKKSVYHDDEVIYIYIYILCIYIYIYIVYLMHPIIVVFDELCIKHVLPPHFAPLMCHRTCTYCICTICEYVSSCRFQNFGGFKA